MKKRVSEGQISGFPREAARGLPVKELCRKSGFSEASFYLWRRKYGGMNVADTKQLNALEAENATLKKLLMEHRRNLGIAALPVQVLCRIPR